jgi:hypothetical protein
MSLGRVSAVRRSGARGDDSTGSDSGVFVGTVVPDAEEQESHNIRRQVERTWVHREEALGPCRIMGDVASDIP